MPEEDPVLALFNQAEGEHFPGSRHTIDSAKKKREQRLAEEAKVVDDETPAWVDNPFFMKKMRYSGKTYTFYTIAALSEALLRRPVTVRKWIREGRFPETPFRTAKNESLGGKRLYTREMIEGAVAVADQEGLLYNQRPLTEQFARQVADIFRQARLTIQKGQ